MTTASAGSVLIGEGLGSNSGSAVASIGDVNGDGIDDLIVGAFGARPDGVTGVGRSYVVFGTASGLPNQLDLATLDGTNGFALDGIDQGDFSGRSVSGGGDVNGDGIDDFIIGAASADPGGANNAGESYIIFGSASGFDATLELSSLDGTNGFMLTGAAAGDASGTSVSIAGDINGDGIDDIVIGASGADPGGNDKAGSVTVLFGGNALAATVGAGSLLVTDGFTLTGVAAGDEAGIAVSGAGDVNGDGLADFLVGASGGGKAYLLFGSLAVFGATIDLGTLNGLNGVTLAGPSGSSFGKAVSAAGDINGDGIDDFIVTAPEATVGGAADAGRAYVVFGTNPGFGATLDLTALDGSDGFVVKGAKAGDLAGSSAAGIRDVNGDGIDDLLIGAPGADPGSRSAAGAAYIVFGSDAGFGAGLDLGTLDGTNGYRLQGVDVADAAGQSVAGGGDLNGDGIADLVIGAPLADNGAVSGSGETYILYGGYDRLAVFDRSDGSADGSISLSGTDDQLAAVFGSDADEFIENYATGGIVIAALGGDDEILTGEGDDLVYAGAGDDDISTTAGSDTIEAGDGDDFAAGGDGRDRIVGGGGNDTLEGEADRDNIDAGDGDDIVLGGDGRDRIEGGEGYDLIVGGEGADRIDGGRGADVLVGGEGSDRLTGDAGLDIFLFAAGDGVDVVTDFKPGNDRISLARSGLTFADLIMVENGSDTIIIYGASDIVRLEDIAITDLTVLDFMF